jgi:hypothetical protein
MTSPEIFPKGEQRFGNLLCVFSSRCRSISQMHRDAQSKIMQRIYNRTTPEEQKWVVRIILKGGAPIYQQVLLKSLMGPYLRFRHLSQGNHRLLGLSPRRP